MMSFSMFVAFIVAAIWLITCVISVGFIVCGIGHAIHKLIFG